MKEETKNPNLDEYKNEQGATLFALTLVAVPVTIFVICSVVAFIIIN